MDRRPQHVRRSEHFRGQNVRARLGLALPGEHVVPDLVGERRELHGVIGLRTLKPGDPGDNRAAGGLRGESQGPLGTAARARRTAVTGRVGSRTDGDDGREGHHEAEDAFHWF